MSHLDAHGQLQACSLQLIQPQLHHDSQVPCLGAYHLRFWKIAQAAPTYLSWTISLCISSQMLLEMPCWGSILQLQPHLTAKSLPSRCYQINQVSRLPLCTCKRISAWYIAHVCPSLMMGQFARAGSRLDRIAIWTRLYLFWPTASHSGIDMSIGAGFNDLPSYNDTQPNKTILDAYFASLPAPEPAPRMASGPHSPGMLDF